MSTVIASHGTRTEARLLGRLPKGEAATFATLRLMRQLARSGARSPILMNLAEQIVSSARAQRGTPAALRALFEWVRDRIAYTRDPGVELLRHPLVTLSRRAEDCDGKATLLAALILALDPAARLAYRVLSVNPFDPTRYSHVYLVANTASGEIPLDATYGGTAFGWEYPRATARKDLAL